MSAPGTVTVTAGGVTIGVVQTGEWRVPLPPESLYVGRMAWTRHTHEAWREVTRALVGQPVSSITVDRLRAMLSQAHGYTAGDPPNHGPMHRDAKHVARLVHAHHARAMARLVARPHDATHERAPASGMVHEGVVVT